MTARKTCASSSVSGGSASATDVRVAVVDPQAYTLPYDDELCRSLAEAGAEVELLTAHFTHGTPPVPVGYARREIFGPPLAGLIERRPTNPARVPLKFVGHAGGLGRLIRRVRNYDVVHWQWAPLPWLDLRALRIAGRNAGATVFTAHDVLPRRSRAAAPLWAELYGSCDRVIVHGTASRDRLLVEVGGITPEHIAVIPHGILHAAAPGSLPPEQAEPRLLFFGLIRPDKGLDVLIEALPAVAERVPAVRLDVVGSPRMPIEPLRERAAVLGVAERINWDLRFVPDSEVPDVFAAARVIALPYRWIEGSGILATALARGVPPVVTSVGTFPELCARYDLGDPVPPGDAAALAIGLVRALTDAGARARAIAGMERARSELAWEHSAQLTLELYQRVLAEKRIV
jgi:glycosyltransferase involved in cell wall biosynthesis